LPVLRYRYQAFTVPNFIRLENMGLSQRASSHNAGKKRQVFMILTHLKV